MSPSPSPLAVDEGGDSDDAPSPQSPEERSGADEGEGSEPYDLVAEHEEAPEESPEEPVEEAPEEAPEPEEETQDSGGSSGEPEPGDSPAHAVESLPGDDSVDDEERQEAQQALFGAPAEPSTDDEDEEEDDDSSGTEPASTKKSKEGADEVEEVIIDGAAAIAVFGLEDEDGREDLEKEFAHVFQQFRLGYFGREFAEEYIIPEGDEDIDPVWPLCGSVLASAAIVLAKRPDGKEIVGDTQEKLKGLTEGDD